MIHFYIVMLSCFLHNSICVTNLKYFETLSHVGVTSSIKRSRDGTRDLMKHVRFRAFDRDFDLTLKSGTHLMAEGFSARLVHEDGSSSYFDIDQSQIFSGHLTDKPDIRVNAHKEDTLWSIQIFDMVDIYVVEPAWRMLNITENPKNDTMIAYRVSDFSKGTFNGSRFCGVRDDENTDLPDQSVQTGGGHVLYNSSDSMRGNNIREKRSPNNASCVLFLVGDYTFYKGKCAGSHVICSSLMFSFVNLVDALFRSSVFEGGRFTKYTNIGLLLGQIILYASYTKPMSSYPHTHFNQDIKWTVYNKLDAFAMYASYMTEYRQFCANHLLTDYPFPNRILGLGWLSSLCLDSSPGHLQRNSGVTSGKDIQHGPIPLIQMNLVFAHGHNFGSEHDPAISECSKPDNEGGNFLMWPYSVSGELPNHHIFSPCSLKHIGRHIEKSFCLTASAPAHAFCGNTVIEQGEECDAGVYGIIDTDKCCSSQCMLKMGAVCSVINEDCCKNCTISPRNTLCLNKNPAECKEASYCTGLSSKCPDPMPMPDWTPCRDTGQCYHGSCLGFCQIKSIKEGHKLKGCLCQTNDNGDACKLCCFDASVAGKPGPCVAHSSESLRDGTQCFLGFCQAGVCEPSMETTIRRLYHYLPSPQPSELMKFMRNNIVLCVIVLSLFLWIPPVYFINKADENEKRELKRQSMEAINQFRDSHIYKLEKSSLSHEVKSPVKSPVTLRMTSSSKIVSRDTLEWGEASV